MYRLIIFLFLSVLLYGWQVSTSIENNLTPKDIKNRIILAKYYLDKNITKTKIFTKQILKIDKNNKFAKNLLAKIKLETELKKVLANKDVDKYYQKLFFNNKYKEIKKLSKFLPVINSDYPKTITAKIYFWDGNYKKTKQILKTIKHKNMDTIDMTAYINYYEGNYKVANKYFKILYNSTGKLDYAYKLIDTYILLDEIDKANKLLFKLSLKYKSNKNLLALKQKLKIREKNRIKLLMKQYIKSDKFEDLQKLVYVLFNDSKKPQAYKLIREYITNHNGDINAKYWYAKYLAWDGDYAKSLKILNSIVSYNEFPIKLLIAKIYSWDAKYKLSINYINDILLNCKDSKIRLEALKLKGLIFYWQNNYKIAKPIFEKILKLDPTAKDMKETLMVMRGDIRPLIKKYKKLHYKYPTNLDYILRVAQYSQQIKDYKTAIKYYEMYYKLNPTLDVGHQLAILYLMQKNSYKAFSYYDPWAYEKNTPQSLYELAKSYYYAGFSKSALKVINDILNMDRTNKDALQLKAQILRYYPTFVQESSKQGVLNIFGERDSNLITLGNRLYFNGFYKDASVYYKKYLLNNPNNYEIRERFAYSLEFSSEYPKASGEFFLLTWQKKNCNILYHYGFSLDKSNKPKLAKKIYTEALDYAVKPAPKFIVNFINNWKEAWQSQKLSNYRKFYVKRLTSDPYWIVKKENVFRKMNYISLYLKDFSIVKEYKKHKKDFYEVKFYQQYTTNKIKDTGYKTLLLECKDKKCLIRKENWQRAKYIPQTYACYNMLSQKLKLNTKNTPTMKELLKNLKQDFVLAEDLKRDVKPSDEVLAIFKVKELKTLPPKKPKIKINNNEQPVQNHNLTNAKVGVKGYYYEDKDYMKMVDYGVFYDNDNYYVDIKKWKLWDNLDNSRDGKYLTFHYKKNKYVFGIELGQYEGKTYLHPYLEYKGYLDTQLFQTITGKEAKSFCAVDKHLTTTHLNISKYKGFNTKYLELTDYWWSFDTSKIESNIRLTPQFQYNFYKHNFNENSGLYLYLSGWYQYNSAPNTCYYSPSTTDSTYIEIHPVYKQLEGVLKLGYSVIDSVFLYSYGLNFTNKYIDAGCMYNASVRNGDKYWYQECDLTAKVKW